MVLGNYMNKYAGEKILSIWWFFALAVIGGGIVIGVWTFYSADININQVQAEILGERIYNCILEKDSLNVDLESLDIFKDCNVDKNLFGVGSLFFLKVKIFSGDEVVFEESGGNHAFEKDCFVSEKTRGVHYPKCYLKEEKVSSKDGELRVDILTGINQEGLRGASV